jgi:hypothetical protein
MTSQLTEIALQMLGTIERMELIIPEITDTIRKALKEKAALAAEPVVPADGEVAELVAWLRKQDGGIGRRATYSRIADILERLAEPEPPADVEVEELASLLRSYADDQIGAGWKGDAVKVGRAADLLEHLVAEPEVPSDDELLKLTENISTEYLCKHKSLPSDWDPGDYASSTKGLIEFARAVLARWGNQS